MEQTARWFRVSVNTPSEKRIIFTRARSTLDAIDNVLATLAEEPGPLMILGVE